MTTTGFATLDYNVWPEFSRAIIFLLTLLGACAGSTGGGFKVSRLIVLLRSIKNEIFSVIHPRGIKTAYGRAYCGRWGDQVDSGIYDDLCYDIARFLRACVAE